MLLFCLWGGEGGGGGGGGGEKYVGWVGNDLFSLSCCYFPLNRWLYHYDWISLLL